jgi:hypothetical protein
MIKYKWENIQEEIVMSMKFEIVFISISNFTTNVIEIHSPWMFQVLAALNFYFTVEWYVEIESINVSIETLRNSFKNLFNVMKLSDGIKNSRMVNTQLSWWLTL